MSETPAPALLENGCITRAIVVLTPLPAHKIKALRPPTPQQFYSEDDSVNSSDSDPQWEPRDDSNSGHSRSKRQKKNHRTTTEKSANNCNKENGSNTEQSLNCYENEPKTRPDLPEEEITVGMTVLAWRQCMKWKHGKILEIVVRENGQIKYKVRFEDKGKSLVSGHHIAFAHTATRPQLYIGARVVIPDQSDPTHFVPGVVAELPSRKNKARFLVFLDNHLPLYVTLPRIHLVCRPLGDVLETISNFDHRSFMERYLKDWPLRHLTEYYVGQTMKVEVDGVQQACKVIKTDCSLILVAFEDSKLEEWIHRGSIRLHIHRQRILESV